MTYRPFLRIPTPGSRRVGPPCPRGCTRVAALCRQTLGALGGAVPLASGAISSRKQAWLTSGMRFNACSWFEFLDEHPAYIRSAVVLENGRI